MPQRALYLAAYDVRDPDRLRRAHELARVYAYGGQKSVHECFCTPTERDELMAAMRGRLDEEVDRFFLLRLDPRAVVITLGRAVPPLDPPMLYLG